MKKSEINQEEIRFLDYLVERENQAIAFCGLSNRLTKYCGNGRWKYYDKVFYSKSFFKYLLIITIEILFSRKIAFKSIMNDKILINDHSNNIISNKILKNIISDTDIKIKNQTIFFPAKVILKKIPSVFSKKVWKTIRKNSYREKPIVCAICEYWINFIIAASLYNSIKNKGLIIVDDFSPKRAALVMAAKSAGIKVGIVAMSDDAKRTLIYPSFQFDIFFCWNQAQSVECEKQWKEVTHLKKTYNSIRCENVLKDNYIIGIALSAFYSDTGLLELITQLRSNNWIEKIIIRFHPRCRPNPRFLDLDNNHISISEGEPDAFFEKIDYLICNNTSLIHYALSYGTFVVYNRKLEAQSIFIPQDVINGVIMDISEQNIDLELLKNVNVFFQGKTRIRSREKILKEDPRAISINDAIEILKA